MRVDKWSYLVFTEAFCEESVGEHVSIRITLTTVISIKQETGQAGYRSALTSDHICSTYYRGLTFHLSERPKAEETCSPH